jgi:hypothetical protein
MTTNNIKTGAVKYFEGQHKSRKLCCYYPDTMRLYDEYEKGRYYRVMYCRNHKKKFRISINSDSFCGEDGVGSIENFEGERQKEVKRLKQLRLKQLREARTVGPEEA